MFKPNFQWTRFLFFTFFALSTIHARCQNLESLKIGEVLFLEKNYNDAIPHYQEVLSHLNHKIDFYHQLLCRLAICHLQTGNEQESLKILSGIKTDANHQNDLFFQLYLKSIAAFQLQNYQEAVFLLSQISTEQLPHSFLNFIALEKGRSLLHLNELDQAFKEFQSVEFDLQFSFPYFLSRLNLIKIDFKKQNFSSAHLLIDDLESKLPVDHPLEIERLYLKGAIFLLEKKEKEGIKYFEKFISKAIVSTSQWSNHILGTTLSFYLKHLSDESLTLNELLELLARSEKILNHLKAYPLSIQSVDLKIEELTHLLSFQKKKVKALRLIQSDKWNKADLELKSLLNDNRISNSAKAELWFWRGFCAEKLELTDAKNECYENVYSLDPKSPFAPSAYFNMYSFQDYLQGSKANLKHLKSFSHLFPDHPLNIPCFYLLGLHLKKNFLSESEKGGQDLSASCDAFEKCLSIFDQCLQKQMIQGNHLPYYTEIHHQALLEKAKTLFTIADQSIDGKKMIYLKYAEDHFYKIVKELNPFSSPHDSKVWAEGAFKLSEVLQEEGKSEERKQILDQMIRTLTKAENYWVVRAWGEKGKMAQQEKRYQEALDYFIKAENFNAHKDLLNGDETLDLLIQQSECHKHLNQLEESMQLLSKVVNATIISPQRIKAMFLRAEIYELQGRNELAIKQLQAVSNKEGEWAKKAQIKLEGIYGM